MVKVEAVVVEEVVEGEEGVAMCLVATISSHHQCWAARCELLFLAI